MGFSVTSNSYSDDRYGNSRGPTGRSKQLSNNDAMTSWEMNNFGPGGKGSNDIEVSRLDDECSSEKNLTSPSSGVSDDAIRVKTTWTVEHDLAR
jgi:hypothetical protein